MAILLEIFTFFQYVKITPTKLRTYCDKQSDFITRKSV